MTCTIERAKEFNNLRNLYYSTDDGFEGILKEAFDFDEQIFTETLDKADKWQEWNYFNELFARELRHTDIVDVAKMVRKELKNEFGNKIKFGVKTKRGYYDSLYITIKECSEEFLIPLDEYMADYKEDYMLRHGREHPYINDEVFKKECFNSEFRLKEDVRDKIREIGELFKFDLSDSMIDYFDFNYSLTLRMEMKMER